MLPSAWYAKGFFVSGHSTAGVPSLTVFGIVRRYIPHKCGRGRSSDLAIETPNISLMRKFLILPEEKIEA